MEKKTFVRGSALNEQDGGAVLNLIWQEKSGIPPRLAEAPAKRAKPPFRFSFAQTERERKQAGKNSFPPTPFLFARLLGLRPQNFSAGRRDRFILSNSSYPRNTPFRDPYFRDKPYHF